MTLILEGVIVRMDRGKQNLDLKVPSLRNQRVFFTYTPEEEPLLLRAFKNDSRLFVTFKADLGQIREI